MRARWNFVLIATVTLVACSAPQEQDDSVAEAQAPDPATQGETPIPEGDQDARPAITQDNPSDEEERERLEQAIGAQSPTVPAPDGVSMADVQAWCDSAIRQDRGETVGGDADAKPCAKHISPNEREASMSSEYYAYDAQGRISHSWSCEADSCSVTAFTYGEIATGDEMLVQQKSCKADGSVSFRDVRYDIEDAGGASEEPRLVQSVELHREGSEDTYKYRIIFDQRGQLVREERFAAETEDYRVAREQETTYGEEGQVLEVLTLSQGTAQFLDVYTYDEEGRLARIDAYSAERFDNRDFPNDLSGVSPDASLERTYDSEGRLATKTETVETQLGARRSFIEGGHHQYSYSCFE